MTPLADLLLFEIPAVVLFLVAKRWPKRVSLRLVTFIFGLISFWTLLKRIGVLEDYAGLLLAAGFAWQGARIVPVHAETLSRLVRFCMGWTALATIPGRRPAPVFQPSRRDFLASTVLTVTGLAAGVYGWQKIPEIRIRSKLPRAQRDVPNVLFIVLDTVRASSLSLYGYDRRTAPWLEEFAKTAVRFDRAFSAAPWTLPSHASMFTGRLPHELSVDWYSPLDATYPTLAEVMAAHGYLTAGFIANTSYCSREFGLHRGFAHYEDFPISLSALANSSALGTAVADARWFRDLVGDREVLGRKHAPLVSQGFLNWVTSRNETPFFAFLNYFDAHDPYLPPLEFLPQYAPQRPKSNILRSEIEQFTLRDLQELRDSYDGCIAYLDRELELMFQQLRQSGILENTVVIITADHGEQFGEHGLTTHGNSLYLPLLHVPLLISFPSRIASATSVREAVSTRELAATILDLVGIPEPAGIPGSSLARYWSSDADDEPNESTVLFSETDKKLGFPSSYPVSKGALKSLLFEGMHYIKNLGDGREELYDIELDPLELNDLANTTQGRETLTRFRLLLNEGRPS
jgi:arylsulfatase A-like enzyme